MKLKDILKGAATLTSVAFPQLAPAIALVNKFLPEDKKLPETATGGDVDSAINSLPPEQQASIREMEVDLEKHRLDRQAEVYIALSKADGQETRAKIALEQSRILCFEILAFTVWSFWNPEILGNGLVWTAFGVLTAWPSTVLMNYFGNLRKEHAQRQITAGADGGAIKGLGILSKILPWSK